MEKYVVAGVEVNKISLKDLLFNKTMYIAYIFLFIAFYGIIEVIYHRYFLISATAFDAGLAPGSREVAEAMREAVFGAGGEVKREAPWSLYIVNYMYMIYVGSGIVFLVALAELADVELIKKTAAGFLTIGLAMVMAGLFTIMMDLNILNVHWMLLSPQWSSGMWLMLPLYAVYIPLVMFEIYLILSHKDSWVKKIAVVILIVSLLVEFVEFYVQAKLFDMNSARHLWTTYPILPLYFMISSFAASLAIMILYAYLAHRSLLLMFILEKATLYFVMALGAYEATAYLFIDKKWAEIILFGDFKYYFYLYLVMAVAIPFALLFKHLPNIYLRVTATISIIIGTYIGKMVFLYGGNAYPLSDRFGVGFEKYYEYDQVKEVIFFMPPLGEIAVVIGSVGVVLVIYKVVDSLFSVSLIREH
ncbi:MAG: NrfD/PsrC family molybdoenzyme membrane anchor subunit [Campylobacterota bacterium]|nr:NrfD/PsrC family molybdoenzyme membrane anchor subunit [Campylobacterota bacterium]